MLTGHAYSRAVRGHLLVQLVLAHIILDGANVSEEEKKDISTMLINMEEFTPDKVKENASLMSTLKKCQYHLETLKENGPTAALWVQYFNMVTLMKKYINFERCGDWDGHLACVQQIIPFFHASGHFQYAKCAHIYVQDMMQLKNSHPQTYKEFAEKGFFTINRTGTPWAGVWSDMVIEQTLMRSMKSSGGLTRGRGITDSVLAKWVCGSPGCTAICTSLEEFAEVVFASGEQHVDFRQSRQQRDSRDRAKIREWFSEHPPFPKLNSLISLSTGVLGNSKVNCHQALDIGTKTMKNFIGRRFSDMKQSKKNVVLSLASMSSSIKNNGETVTVNPLTIFQRTVIAKKNDEDVADLLTYELTPFPMSLFHEGVMRKGKKSSLYDVLPVENNAALDLNQTTNVVDGGFLLHRMKWKPSSSVSSICHQYITYVQKHYGTNCMVVFDGYSDVNSTKRAEQKRRGLTRTSVDINCNENTIITVQQEHFLANENNKTRLIQFLTEKMTAAGIETTVATGDADGTIVSCGLDKAAVHPTVVIVGEDVDLIVLLMGLAPPNINVFFMKPGRGKVETKLFSVRQLQQLEFAKSILLLHSFSGCDTTSAIHGKSKVGIAKLFTAKPDLTQNISDIFSGLSTSPESNINREEIALPYMRPPLNKELWREPDLATRAADPDTLVFHQWNGKRRRLAYEPNSFYLPTEKLREGSPGAGVARGWTVTALDVDKHEAKLSARGTTATLTYDKCLIATGVRAKRCAALRAARGAGLALALRSARDVARLAAALQRSRGNVVVLGGGAHACELAASLAERLRDTDKRVVMMFREATPLADELPDYLAAHLARTLQTLGVDLLPNTEVTDSRVSSEQVHLQLSKVGGEEISPSSEEKSSELVASLVVECVGIEPNTELAASSGLEVHPDLGGVVVNAEMQARAGVFAAGDAACFHEPLLGRRRVARHDHAVASGRVAGANMAALEPPRPYTHQPMLWTDVGPRLGYEAIGIIDSRLPTVGVFSADAVTEAGAITNREEDAATKQIVLEVGKQIPSESASSKHASKETDGEIPSSGTSLQRSATSSEPSSRSYERGVVFYLKDKRVVGVLLWNLFNRMHIARQVLKQGEFEDMFEVAKLFSLHEED
ncbi:unnamed protein product [Parnassius mnemosyne]|uniref:Uncharacterized protein n=1 Tax=Parnassius mnemosyne TaxID=213953 RepID=A0AAV1L0I4_9NEOP